MGGEILRLDAVSKRYGALLVTDGVSLSVKTGTTVGILGPNGAGKTTLFNLISGDVRPDSGSIVFKGRPIGALPPFQRCRLGIGRSYQVPHPFGGLTVFENLLVAATHGAGLSEEDALMPCLEILESAGLAVRANEKAGSLRLLDRKRLELARALATQPELLLLDEVAGGLTQNEALELVQFIGRIKARGTTIVWIEHVVHALMAVADRLVVINFGAILADGVPGEVIADAEVRRVYMGLEVPA